MLFWQFSNIIIYVKIVGKILDEHLNVWLFSNPEDKVQKRWRTTGQICPVLLTRIWTLSPGLENNDKFKCWSGIFQQSWHIWLCWKIASTTFQCMVVLQSRGQNLMFVEISRSQDIRVEPKDQLKGCSHMTSASWDHLTIDNFAKVTN